MSSFKSKYKHSSDIESCATTVPETVMAEQVANDVVKEAQSVGRSAPIDESASTTNDPAVNGDPPSGTATTKPTPSEAPSTKPAANGIDTASAGSVHVSQKTQGQATAWQADNKQSGTSQHETRQPHLAVGSSELSVSDSQAVADASGGSDTDISRPGSVDQSKRDGSHVRTSSAAKKQPFKSVSVTKSFLAKTVTSTPAARPGDKATPTASLKTSNVLSAKPRLVAKSGTSNTPRTLGQANGAGAGPDASKVWNKNQPVPPPPPKQFTDEELKQQYGIHLATRLQADEAGKEAKWADIDDDEDDWAPETVQWMDGTKSSVAVQPETPVVPAEEPKTILKPEVPAETPKPSTSPAPTANPPKPSVTGGNKTILKPGAHAQPTGKSSLVLKGQPEKPTLVAKPSATEKKSPWAPLPPIEKVSPAQINPPPAHQPPPRYSQRESHGYDSMSPQPTKEIAPDDFNRSWRNDTGGRDARDGRELFNSQSGRYEPVHNDARRSGGRDSGFRQQPSLLQRPAQDGPAEPSAAFQTSRASADGPAWGRRRNSSNVSGGMPRRMSIDPRAPDMPTGPMHMERRESHSVNGYDYAESVASRNSPFQQMRSPNVAHAHPASPYGSVTSPAMQDAPAPAQAPPVENPVEVQKRLMAEKIERARLKKQQDQEAEKRAEAERKERIAKKLAAMGPPESKPKPKEQSPSRPEKPLQKEKTAAASVQSPPKPPIPTADGEVTQYGMMKVHQPHPVKKSPQAEHARPSQQAPSAPAPSLEQQPAQSFDSLARDSEKSRLTVHADAAAHQTDGAVPSGPRPQGPPAAWSPATAPQPRPWTSQVWGPPQAKDRALGNGTFDSGYRGQSRPGAQPPLPVQAPATAPIGTAIAPQSLTPQSTRQMPASQPMFQQRTPHAQPPPPSRSGRVVKPITGGGWDTFGELILKDDQEALARSRQERDRQGEGFRPELRETYKDQRGQAQVTLHDKVVPDIALVEGLKKDDVPKPVNEGQSPQQVLGQGTLQQATGSRASRFFPRPTESSLDAMSSSVTHASNKADSPPPPPETETHPAFSSDAGHPLVRLPKPSPVVRLPPLASGTGPSPTAQVTMPSRGQALGARPLAMNPEWQARFNKLLDKPGSTRPASNPANPSLSPAVPQQGAVAPAALSKASLDVRGSTGPATVSLPTAPQRNPFSNDRGSEVITRKGAEALFEDREFGSLPTVKLSKVSHLAADQPPKAAPKDEQHPKFKKFENPFTIRRLEAFDIEKTAQYKGKFDVVIRIANMREPVTKSVQRKHYGPKLNRQTKPKPAGSPNAAFSNAAKDRPRKPSQQSQTDRSYTSNSTTHPSGAKSWSSNSNTRTPSTHQPTTWAKLAAA
ncbi:hypothetical protein PSV09DRAFT_2379419 [Bipolaris maydis]|uniref:uncharacterized protein n=1 Tax=Cochliobolus heterostrophus TaxID=5016 RepID=UPI0024D79A87|nr:hypothetical protein J3E73DRAFT_204181 [Bipolaris maydis]KAJ6213886.1 hypothetical protein PSV09DRAFT_2379419 [Bipolaris maydis]KAJ6275092.1 hypothetical protein PSV08DRAFT_195847 [Bipolaris maydis]